MEILARHENTASQIKWFQKWKTLGTDHEIGIFPEQDQNRIEYASKNLDAPSPLKIWSGLGLQGSPDSYFRMTSNDGQIAFVMASANSAELVYIMNSNKFAHHKLWDEVSFQDTRYLVGNKEAIPRELVNLESK